MKSVNNCILITGTLPSGKSLAENILGTNRACGKNAIDLLKL
jgi:hypothetical protein